MASFSSYYRRSQKYDLSRAHHLVRVDGHRTSAGFLCVIEQGASREAVVAYELSKNQLPSPSRLYSVEMFIILPGLDSKFARISIFSTYTYGLG